MTPVNALALTMQPNIIWPGVAHRGLQDQDTINDLFILQTMNHYNQPMTMWSCAASNNMSNRICLTHGSMLACYNSKSDIQKTIHIVIELTI